MRFTCAVIWEQYVDVNHGYLYQLDLDLSVNCFNPGLMLLQEETDASNEG